MKKYAEPKIEVVKFDDKDVVRTSFVEVDPPAHTD